MENFDEIKEYFKYADEDTKTEIAVLEKKLKSNQLYVNLGEHDGMKMITAFCVSRVEKINKELQVQTAEELSKEENRVLRARKEAYRDSFQWFINIFTISRARVESATKKVGKIRSSIKDNA